MTTVEKLKDEPAEALFDELGDARVGMLGVEGSHQHMQPMTHHLDRAEGALYFITSLETDLVRAVGTGATAHYCLIGADQEFYACMKGPIEQIEDQAKLDEVWSVFAAAWFEKGRSDPNVCLLRVMLHEASVWATGDNPVSIGWELAKSLMGSEDQPDIGTHIIIDFTTRMGRAA